ncbi:MAG: pyridoxal phosphate-dependent aminotransferase [Clostridia bacterium]|jgi:aspartate aminotransferase
MFSKKMVQSIGSSSMIRAMFEEGERLRKLYGADKVYDFSIGNPDTEPPQSVRDAIIKYASSNEPGEHRYMSNAGYSNVRKTIAESISKNSGISISDNNVVMTCGAAGGLNVSLKAILNPDDEVVVIAPFFMEYLSYIDNNNGKSVVIEADTDTFEPNFTQLIEKITKKTKAVIINSPNNPTGIVYSEKILTHLNDILLLKGKEFNTTIFVLSDEPYSKIVYDSVTVPSVLKFIKNSIIVNSFSKSLALPGERIGYIAVSPLIDDHQTLSDIMVICNRILGFVNAPALFQKVVASTINEGVNVREYQNKRDLLFNGLIDIGFECIKPQGAFYLFPKSLIADDVEFTKRASKYNLLFVPGSGFGCPGYFRLAYCVNIKTIENSLPSFRSLYEEFK